MSKNGTEASALSAVGSGDREGFGRQAKPMVRGEESENKRIFEIEGFSDSVVFGSVDGLGIKEIEANRVPFQFSLFEKTGTK